MTLLLSIARCEVMRQQLQPGADPGHSCHPVVTWQARHGIAPQQVPEPWSGNLAQAPLLFVSSNPAIGREERYPTLDWPDEAIVRFFEHRFGADPEAPIVGGARVLMADGGRGRANPYLSWVRARAAELGCGEPGTGYALTEVVHCKSSNESTGGAGGAMRVCLERHGRNVLERAGARVWVFVGAHAARAAGVLLGIAPRPRVQGPFTLFGRERVVVFMPHPNARGGPKTIGGCLTEEQVSWLAEWWPAVGR